MSNFNNSFWEDITNVSLEAYEPLLTFDQIKHREMSNNSEFLYHVSRDENANTITFHPRLPGDNELIRDGFEDGKVARVCFSDSIGHCLRAFDAWCMKQFKKKDTLPLTVYVVSKKDIPKNKFISNETIVEKKLVPDAEYTHECWVLQPVVLRKYCKIKVTGYTKIANIELKNKEGKVVNNIPIYDCEYKLKLCKLQ